MFVALTDFNVSPYSLPNLTAGNFDAFRDQEEEVILRMVLGDALYGEFIAGLAPDWASTVNYGLNALVASGNDVYKSLQVANLNHLVSDGAWWVLVTASDKWLLLKKGNSYVYLGETYRYSGLKPLLLPYIYSRWTEVKSSRNSGIGVVKAKAENSDVIYAGDDVATSWNAFARLVGVAQYGDTFQPLDTLAGFLYANKVIYPDWRYKSPGRKSIFNL